MLNGIKCRNKSPRCRAIAKRLFLSNRQAQQARHFNPTLLYMRADGELIVPGRNDERQLPKDYIKSLHKQGYKKVEISTFREYEKFQKEISQKLQSRADAHNYREQEAYDREVKEQIDFLKRGGMVELPTENGKGSRIVNMPPLDKLDHPQIRRLAEYAIEKMKNYKFRSDNVNPMIQAMEFDNIKYSDRDTNNKRRNY